jgi:pimeloyl-ACP methyl ester carboxylesterase
MRPHLGIRRRSVNLSAVFILTAGCVLAVSAAGSTATSCGGGGSQLQPLTSTAQSQLSSSVPVLFVHGINSSAEMWNAQSVAGSVAKLRGVTAWTFNYGSESLDWVTNNAIGPALASSISCLAQVSGKSVIIVAHSMGGLATQEAIGEPRSPAAGKVAEVITLGTPYTGSELDTIAEDAINGGLLDIGNPIVAFVEGALSLCAGYTAYTAYNPCSFISAARSPVGTALESNSPEIQQLPKWPASLPVLDVAGNMNVSIGVGTASFHVNPGDGAVLTPSATAHNTISVPDAVSCSSDLVHMWQASCFHTSLPDNAKITADILADIQQTVTRGTAIDWKNTAYTMTCGGAAAQPFTISLKDGVGVAPGPGTSSGSYNEFEVHVEAVTQPGSLTGLGNDETAVLLYCSPQPSNYYNEEVQVFRSDGTMLAELPLARTLPGTPLYDSAQFSIENGQLVTGMNFYGPGDSHASGPSIHKIVTWRWNGQQFVHSPISIPQAPACPKAAPGVPAGLVSAVAPQVGNQCDLEIENLKTDPQDQSWVIFTISPTPGSTAQGGGGIAHEVDGAWPVVLTGSAFYWCGSQVPAEVDAAFNLQCPDSG